MAVAAAGLLNYPASYTQQVAVPADQWADRLAVDRAALDRGSTAERVAEVLRTRITEGVLAPGTRLSEEALTAALGVSRNTLRESFRLLGHEGLLVHELNRGVFVRLLNVDDVRDLYRIRRILEFAAVQSAAGAAPAKMDRIREAVESAEAAAAAGDWVRVGTENMRFHQAVAALAGSPRVDETMRRVLAELRLVFHVMQAPREFHEPYLRNNREIYQLLAVGQTLAAAAAVQAPRPAAARILDGQDLGRSGTGEGAGRCSGGGRVRVRPDTARDDVAAGRRVGVQHPEPSGDHRGLHGRSPPRGGGGGCDERGERHPGGVQSGVYPARQVHRVGGVAVYAHRLGRHRDAGTVGGCHDAFGCHQDGARHDRLGVGDHRAGGAPRDEPAG